MCKAASFVLTKDCVFWSKKTDSHEEIIREHGLNADGANGPNILRAEINPVGFFGPPFDGWKFHYDQDIIPKWADAGADEKRARAALADWYHSRVNGFDGSLDLRGTSIKALPDGIKVGGSLNLSDTAITALPDGLEVGGDLDLSDTAITALPDGLKVGGDLYLRGTAIKALPDGLKVGGYLDLRGTAIKALPDGLKVGGRIYR